MLVSIITINYNDLKGLKKTMASVLEQTYENIEYIVIDGGSTDGSKEHIERCQQDLAYWVSEPDQGIYNAMNKGINVARGDYLLFLNSGDMLKNNAVLKKVKDEFSNNLDIYYGDLEIEKNSNFITNTYPDTLTFSYFYHKGYLPHPSTFIKRDLFDRVYYYNEDFKIVGDWDFLVCAVCKHNATYKHVDMVISKYNTDGISSDPAMRSLLLEEKYTSLENNFSLFLKDTKELVNYRSLFQNSRYKLLHKLEKNKFTRKANSAWLYLLSVLFKL